MYIHPQAVVSPRAQIGPGTRIGPFCVIEDDVVIGEDCVLASHVVVKSKTVLGAANQVFEGAILGGVPQHLKASGETGWCHIGDSNILREHVTIHRGLHANQATQVGHGNMFMVGVHIAHDCQIGNHTIIANYAGLAGHVAVQDRAYISAAVGIHQFCRVGELAMVGGHARIVKDVPPFVTIDGGSSFVVGLNLVGLRRHGFDSLQINSLKQAYRHIYRSGLPWSDLLESLQEKFPHPPGSNFFEFFREGTRGFTPERRLPPPAATLKLRSEDRDDPDLGLDKQSKAG